MFGSFLGLLLIGSPIVVALGLSSLITMFYLDENPIKMVQIAFTSVGSFPLMALPAFILAGALMEAAGMSKRLIKIAETLTGSFTGGLSAATVISCLFFGAISGSGPATTAAVGMLMIPAMVKRNYGVGYASAITASAGGLGVIIPPSIPMVVYGISAMGIRPPVEAVSTFGTFQSVSIGKLFLAGFLPATLMATTLLIMNYIICRKRGFVGSKEGISAKKVFCAIKDGIWSVLTPFLILIGIYSGFFTPTEAAIVAIFYTLFIGAFVYKELKLKDINEALRSTTWLTGRVLLILFTAILFGRVLLENNIPDFVAQSLLSVTNNMYVIWIFIIGLLLFVGMFMETLALILILVPVMLPIAYGVGIDPIHFGVVMIASLSIGFQTPPLGENLFVASGISGMSIERISMRAIPFAISGVIAVFVIAMFPQISLWLPSLLFK